MSAVLDQPPATLRWTTMGEIADVIGGGTPRTFEPENFEGGDIPWITPADLSGYTDKFISSGARFITQRGLESSSARVLPAGTVLFTSRAPIGYVAIASNPIATNQGFKSFVLRPGVLPEYVYWWLRGAKRKAESLASGTTFLELSGANAKKLPIPLVDLEEQRRIVAEIEKQFSRLDEAVANLQRVKARIRHYKRAILESATVAWPMVATGQLCDCIVPNRDKPGSFSGDIPWLTLPDFDGNEIEIGRSKVGLGLTAAEVLTSRARVVPAGSVVMSCIGRFGITAVLQRPAVINQQLHAFLPSDRVVPKYLAYALRTRVREMESKATATTIAYLNKTNCNSISVPVPPLAEQHRIVAEVDRCLSVVREVEADVDANLKRAQALRQSVLARAFAPAAN